MWVWGPCWITKINVDGHPSDSKWLPVQWLWLTTWWQLEFQETSLKPCPRNIPTEPDKQHEERSDMPSTSFPRVHLSPKEHSSIKQGNTTTRFQAKSDKWTKAALKWKSRNGRGKISPSDRYPGRTKNHQVKIIYFIFRLKIWWDWLWDESLPKLLFSDRSYYGTF